MYKRQVQGADQQAQLDHAVELSVLKAEQAKAIAEYEPLRLEAIYVDDFSKAYLQGISFADQDVRPANAA